MERQEYKATAATLATMNALLTRIKSFADVVGALNPRFDRDQTVAHCTAGNSTGGRRRGDCRSERGNDA